MTDQMASSENVSVTAAALALAISEVELVKRCNAGQYYLLVRQAENVRFPSWQLAANEAGLRTLIHEFKLANRGRWALHGFVGRPHSDLGGVSPKDYLSSREFDLKTMELLLMRQLQPEQGAF